MITWKSVEEIPTQLVYKGATLFSISLNFCNITTYRDKKRKSITCGKLFADKHPYSAKFNLPPKNIFLFFLQILITILKLSLNWLEVLRIVV